MSRENRSVWILTFVFIFAAAAVQTARGAVMTAGNTAVGTNAYPAGVGGFSLAGELVNPLSDGYYGFNSVLIDPAGNFAYLGGNDGNIVKVSLPDLAFQKSLALNAGSVACAVIAPAGDYGYFLAGKKIHKVRLSDLTVEKSLENVSSAYAAIDAAGKYAYFCANDVIKVLLSDLTVEGRLFLKGPDPEDPTSYGMVGQPVSVVIDNAAGFAYFGTTGGYQGGYVVKVRLSDFTIADVLCMHTNTDGYLRCALIDPVAGYAYFGNFNYGPVLYKVRLSDFSVEKVIGLPYNGLTNETGFICAAIAPDATFAYFESNLGNLFRVRLSDFKFFDSLSLTVGEDMPYDYFNETIWHSATAAIDPAGNFAYLFLRGKLIKISLNDGINHTIHATKTILPQSAAIDSVSLYSHQSGGSVRLAIYGEGTNHSKALLWQSPSTSNTTTNGWLSIPIAMGTPASLKLPAGTYWLAFNSDSPKKFASCTTSSLGMGFRTGQQYGSFPVSLAQGNVVSSSELWSEYMSYTPFFINRAPDAPVVKVSPNSPGTLDDVTAVAAANDPDAAVGDRVVAYRYEWLLGGSVKCTSATLSANLTTRGQQWTLKAWAQDSYGQWSTPGQTSFTIVNTTPSQPIVQILPKPARAGQDLVVDVQVYATDPDGDQVAYDFNWYKSTDGGATWIHKVELDGSSQVSGLYIHDGELWEVRHIPYEKAQTVGKPGIPKSSLRAASRIEGKYGWDRAYIGVNTPPTLTLETPLVQRQAGGTRLSVGWIFYDAEGEARTVDLEWTSKALSSYKPLASGLPVRQSTFRILTFLPVDQPVTVRAVIHDAKGAVTQQISAPALVLPPSPALVTSYVLGKSSDPSGLDVNHDTQINVADVLKSVASTLPEVPTCLAPANGATGVSITPTLNWSDCPHTQSYQVYLWKANTARPVTPVATSLTASAYTPKTALDQNAVYWWQVVAVGVTGLKATGPVWTLATR